MSVTSAHLTRGPLGLDPLDLVDDTYDLQIDDAALLDIGQTTWRRQTADSPYVPGRVVTAMVKDTTTMTFKVDVKGASPTDVQTAVGTLLTAAWQSHYQFQITIEDAQYCWRCEPADTNVGFTLAHVFGFICPVTLSMPRSPIPVNGPI